MLPYLQIGSFRFATYSLLIILGFIFGLGLAVYRAPIYQQNRADILHAGLYAALGLFIGGKLFYFLTIWPELSQHWAQLWGNKQLLLALFATGFVFYGGLLGAIGGVWCYTRQFHLSFWAILETLIPAVPLIHAFGRLGCFCAGCCYGIPWRYPGAVVFPEGSFALANTPLAPVQLWEAGCNILICIALLFFTKKQRLCGQVIGLYSILYAICRFILEFYRGDINRGFWCGLATSQWFSLALLPVGFFFFFFFSRCHSQHSR